MSVSINIDLSLPDPEYKIKEMLDRVSERRGSALLRDDNAFMDAVLRVLQGETGAAVPEGVRRIFRLWMDSQQRIKMHTLLFAGCTNAEIASALSISDTGFVSNYGLVFFDVSVFAHGLERAAYAESCARNSKATPAAYRRMSAKERDTLKMNASLSSAFRLKQDAVLAKYTDEINFPRATTRVATNQYVAYARCPNKTLKEIQEKQNAAKLFLRSAESLPAIRDAHVSGSQDFKIVLEAKILDLRKSKLDKKQALLRDRLDPEDIA